MNRLKDKSNKETCGFDKEFKGTGTTFQLIRRKEKFHAGSRAEQKQVGKNLEVVVLTC